jgi:protein-L-isoaspartate(D-aspartate) O-methyltransferase
MEAFKSARINMVKGQILPNDIKNQALIDVLTEIPRHIFIPDERRGVAYIDGSLLVGEGRYILPPMVFAKMVEALGIKGDESVLDIACGTGYSSAVLANLCKKVCAIESSADLASKAHQNLNSLGIANVIIISNLLAEGHKESAPYDVILINGAVREVPGSLFAQLSENGKIVAILSKAANAGSIVLFNKTNGKISSVEIFDVNLQLIEDF